MSKPIRVFWSPLSRRFYATRAYREDPRGFVTVTGEQFDVTNDIARLIIENDITFTSVTEGVDGWIEIKEGCELPIQDETVYVRSPLHSNQHLGRLRHDNSWTFSGSNSDWTDSITHWKPIVPPQSGVDGREK